MKKKIKILLYTVGFSVLCLNMAKAQQVATLVPITQQKNLNIAIYNADIALVKDTRQTDLIAGRNRVTFENISAQIIPESALLNGQDISVIEQNFDYDLISSVSLLEKSVGNKVFAQTTNPQTGEKFQEEALLLAYNGRPIISINNQIYTDFKGDILLENMPKGLISKPSLSLDLNARTTHTQSLDLTYLTRGLSWHADYVAELNEAENQINLNGFITLSNQSGTNFENADMQLVAGDVKTVQKVMPRMMMASAKGINMISESFDSAMPSVEEVSDFYVYSLPFKTSVQSKQTKQVSLLSAPNVSIQKEYVYDNVLKPYHSEMENIKPVIFYKFLNLEKDGLGMALPQGTIRLYKKDKNNKSVFLGENIIKHTPNLASISLRMGEAFDIFANAKRIDYQKTSTKTSTSAYEIIFKNGSKSDKNVIIYENFSGNWKISEENIPYERVTAHRVKWVLSIPAEGKTTLTYRVKIANE